MQFDIKRSFLVDMDQEAALSSDVYIATNYIKFLNKEINF